MVRNNPHGEETPLDGTREPLQVKVGDVVLFARWGGHQVKELGDDLYIMSEGDILAVIEQD
jgi:chaperonin GroES